MSGTELLPPEKVDSKPKRRERTCKRAAELRHDLFIKKKIGMDIAVTETFYTVIIEYEKFE